MESLQSSRHWQQLTKLWPAPPAGSSAHLAWLSWHCWERHSWMLQWLCALVDKQHQNLVQPPEHPDLLGYSCSDLFWLQALQTAPWVLHRSSLRCLRQCLWGLLPFSTGSEQVGVSADFSACRIMLLLLGNSVFQCANIKSNLLWLVHLSMVESVWKLQKSEWK